MPERTFRRVTRTLAKWLAVIAALLVVTWLLATAWWNLWMNRGWPGAPPILTPILGHFILVDGETAYDCEFLDMAATAFFALCGLSSALLWRNMCPPRKAPPGIDF